MNEEQFPPEIDSVQTAELVAYLDGELDGEAARQLEDRLASEPELARQLQSLDRAWHALEVLPRAELDVTFARTTVEMVALSVEREAATALGDAPARRRREWLLGAAALLAAALLGFAGTVWLTHNTNDELIRALPVLENLDAYQAAGSVQVLEELLASHVLQSGPVEGLLVRRGAEPPRLHVTDEPAADRRQRLEQLSPAEQETLRTRMARFQALPTAEQQALLDLHAQLVAHPQRAALEEQLALYVRALGLLGPAERMQLLSLPSAERYAVIRATVEQATSPLPELDRMAFGQWLFQQLRARLQPEQVAALDDAWRRQDRRKLAEVIRKALESSALVLQDDSAWAELCAALSPPAREQAERAQTRDARLQLVRAWAAQLRFAGRSRQPDMHRWMLEQLPPEERARIEQLPEEERRQELQKLMRRMQERGFQPGGAGRGARRPSG